MYDFEKKRNKLQKYDRETMLKTIRAMKRIAEIKNNRENVRTPRALQAPADGGSQAFIRNRLKTGSKLALKEDLKELSKYREAKKNPMVTKEPKKAIRATTHKVATMDTTGGF